MKYILLDTNIIMDIIFDRKKGISGDIISKFIQLLNSGEVRLVVPEIVIQETFRNVDKQIADIKNQIDISKREINKILSVQTVENGKIELNERKEKALNLLEDCLKEYNKKRDSSIKEVHGWLSLFFHNENTIIIDDISLMDLALKRRIYKKAPFHHESKESYGDGIITETLLNIKRFINIECDDIIYFVTGNTRDFSAPGNKKALHEDILKDLETNNLVKNVNYVTSLGVLVSSQLKLEYKGNIVLMDEVEKELALRNHEEYLKDLDREYVGLPPLSSFNGMVENEFFSSKFYNELSKIKDSIDEVREWINNICMFYDDEFFELLYSIPLSDLSEILSQFKDIGIEVDLDCVQGIFNLQEFSKNKYEKMKKLEIGNFDDYFEFGHNYEIYSFDQTKYQLIIPNLNLNPLSGETDEIEVTLKNEKDMISNMCIDIYYGYATYDEDNNVQDAAEESISCHDNGIIDKLKKLLQEWDNKLKYEEKIIANIERILENNGTDL